MTEPTPDKPTQEQSPVSKITTLDGALDFFASFASEKPEAVTAKFVDDVVTNKAPTILQDVVLAAVYHRGFDGKSDDLGDYLRGVLRGLSKEDERVVAAVIVAFAHDAMNPLSAREIIVGKLFPQYPINPGDWNI